MTNRNNENNIIELVYKPLLSSNEVNEKELFKMKLASDWKDIYWKIDIEVLRDLVSSKLIEKKQAVFLSVL